MRRMTIAIAGAALAAGLMTGCSDDESSSPSAGSSSSDATSAEAATEVGEAYCDAIADLDDTDAESDPDSVRDALDRAAANAPGDQADDFTQVSEAYDDYADAVDDFLDDIPDVPGVDSQQLLEDNRAALDSLSARFLASTSDLREQLVEQGREDCDLG